MKYEYYIIVKNFKANVLDSEFFSDDYIIY